MELKPQSTKQETIVEKYDDNTGIYISEEKAKFLIEDAIAKAKSEILHDAQSSYITVFGIFASILSFLTIEIQFFKTQQKIYEIVAFSLILWALLVSFNLVLAAVIKNKSDNEANLMHKCLVASILSALIFGIVILLLEKLF